MLLSNFLLGLEQSFYGAVYATAVGYTQVILGANFYYYIVEPDIFRSNQTHRYLHRRLAMIVKSLSVSMVFQMDWARYLVPLSLDG